MSELSTGQCATLACLLEVAAPKVGNVHRGADFEDLTLGDFLTSGVAIGPVFERAAGRAVGTTVLDAIRATRALVKTNTNLGIVLLMAPLAAVPRDEPLGPGVARVLAGLTPDDARDVYAAIQLAQPGGLGDAAEHDVRRDAPPADLLIAMRAASERDLVARQYVENFSLVLDTLVPRLCAARDLGLTLPQAIVHTQIQTMAELPDSLIARKCGAEVADQAKFIARQVLEFAPPGTDDWGRALADFDFWLRSDGHRRNPGTTADLIAAALFAGLRDGRLAGA